jgi:hypothetical protein
VRDPDNDANQIVQYAIYEHPEDFPEGYVVRRWLIINATPQAGKSTRFATADQARASLPAGVVLLKGIIDPDPHIIEVWM